VLKTCYLLLMLGMVGLGFGQNPPNTCTIVDERNFHVCMDGQGVQWVWKYDGLPIVAGGVPPCEKDYETKIADLEADNKWIRQIAVRSLEINIEYEKRMAEARKLIDDLHEIIAGQQKLLKKK
jgi:hypothetical protein